MGINVHNLIDRKQDEYDQREDQEILTTLIQQQQIMIQQQNAYFHFHSKQIDHGFQVLAEKIEGLREKSQDKENMLVQDRAAIPQTFNIKDLTSSEIEKSAVLSSSLPSSNDIFINGVWFNRYQQYGVWYGPFQHYMSFNANNNIFQGHGEDNYGTGDPQLNFGHQCLCKMTWNKERHVFEGIMFVPDGWTMVPCGLFEMSFVKS
ncbi:unnamed protein product [Rotaria sordida]|uniref:Uncharacterized protein n=1 Tax=Rotaria sordida TaxID=392033 RepID=A0A815UY50_9BILA|nr:unnamed protein product [Rotaria sordida]CAF1523602.1 unnamed protein product [Rotaria sordida]